MHAYLQKRTFPVISSSTKNTRRRALPNPLHLFHDLCYQLNLMEPSFRTTFQEFISIGTCIVSHLIAFTWDNAMSRTTLGLCRTKDARQIAILVCKSRAGVPIPNHLSTSPLIQLGFLQSRRKVMTIDAIGDICSYPRVLEPVNEFHDGDCVSPRSA